MNLFNGFNIVYLQNISFDLYKKIEKINQSKNCMSNQFKNYIKISKENIKV